MSFAQARGGPADGDISRGQELRRFSDDELAAALERRRKAAATEKAAREKREAEQKAKRDADARRTRERLATQAKERREAIAADLKAGFLTAGGTEDEWARVGPATVTAEILRLGSTAVAESKASQRHTTLTHF